jgi:hypothetical protein
VAMQELWEVISGIVSIPPPALCSLRLAPLILLRPTIGTLADTHFDGNRVNQDFRDLMSLCARALLWRLYQHWLR